MASSGVSSRLLAIILYASMPKSFLSGAVSGSELCNSKQVTAAQNQYSRLPGKLFCKLIAAFCAPRQSRLRTVPQSHSRASASSFGRDFTARSQSCEISLVCAAPSPFHTRVSRRRQSTESIAGVFEESCCANCRASEVLAGVDRRVKV